MKVVTGSLVTLFCAIGNVRPIKSIIHDANICAKYETFLSKRYPIGYSCSSCETLPDDFEGNLDFLKAQCLSVPSCSKSTNNINNIPFEESTLWTGKSGSFKLLHSVAEKSMTLTDTGDVIRLKYNREPSAQQDSTTCNLYVKQGFGDALEKECAICDLRNPCGGDSNTADVRFYADCSNVIENAIVNQCDGSGYDGTIFQVLDRSNHKEGSCPPPPDDSIDSTDSIGSNDSIDSTDSTDSAPTNENVPAGNETSGNESDPSWSPPDEPQGEVPESDQTDENNPLVNDQSSTINPTVKIITSGSENIRPPLMMIAIGIQLVTALTFLF